MSIVEYATYIIACIIIVIVPGPTVTLIMANSLRFGARAGLLNIAGTQAGLGVLLLVLAIGISAVITQIGAVFEWLRLFGAAYLIWLGIRLWRAGGIAASAQTAAPDQSRGRFFWQGPIVALSNPKLLLFFSAFIPQFIDPHGSAFWQVLWLGFSFIVVAVIFDSLYALACDKAGRWVTQRNVRLVERLSGSFLIGGGLWLAVSPAEPGG